MLCGTTSTHFHSKLKIDIFHPDSFKLGTHLSTHRSALNCLSVPVWTVQTIWGIPSEHAHALREPDPIAVGSSKWALFWACSVWTAFLTFLLPRWWTGVFMFTPNKFFMEFTFGEQWNISKNFYYLILRKVWIKFKSRSWVIPRKYVCKFSTFWW